VAVYTDVTDEALERFLAPYDLGAVLAFKGIAEGVSNTNYFLQTARDRFILTLYEARAPREDLPFFLGLMEHLARAGVTCPQPVRARDGQALGEIAGRPAALVTFLEGISIRRPTASHCAAAGESLASLHEAGRDFPGRRANPFSVGGWRPLFEAAAGRADAVAPGLSARTEAAIRALEREWPLGLPEGTIHADLFPDNVLFVQKRLSGLIDFYFACTDGLAFDLAVCLNAWCFEPDGAFNVTKGRALIEGYQRIRPLAPEEVEALPILCRGAALRFMLTRIVDWLDVPPGALVKPHDPLEYDRKLAFHAGVPHAASYGLAR